MVLLYVALEPQLQLRLPVGRAGGACNIRRAATVHSTLPPLPTFPLQPVFSLSRIPQVVVWNRGDCRCKLVTMAARVGMPPPTAAAAAEQGPGYPFNVFNSNSGSIRDSVSPSGEEEAGWDAAAAAAQAAPPT